MKEFTMNGGDYLWDRSGPVDADVARLESILAGHQHAGREPELVIGPRAEVRVEAAQVIAFPRSVARGRGLAAAAMVVLAVLAGLLARPAVAPWLSVEARDGRPLVGSRPIDGRMHVGEWLRTDDKSSAQIEVASIGRVTVRPNSLVRVKNTGKREHRLEMRHGSIHAFITAPPRLFVVDTPAATAVDMGCEYTLDVDPDGSGILKVSLGHVLLEGSGDIVSDVPMNGGTCKIRKGMDPGTPYFDDASTQFVDALTRFDFEGQGERDLGVVLDEARERDSLSLWHLIPRTQGALRRAVVDRLSVLKPIPDKVSREGVMQLDPAALEAWNNAMRPY